MSASEPVSERCSLDDIRDGLETVAGALGRSLRLGDRALRFWHATLREYKAGDVRTAFGRLASSARAMPTLADTIEAIRGAGGRLSRETLAGCPDCDGTGRRRVSCRWTEADARVDDRERHQVVLAACSCRAGERYEATHGRWDRIVQDWQGLGREVWWQTRTAGRDPLEPRKIGAISGGMMRFPSDWEAARNAMREAPRSPRRDWHEEPEPW